MAHNSLRLAHVWMDEYKVHKHTHTNSSNLEPSSDLTSCVSVVQSGAVSVPASRAT